MIDFVMGVVFLEIKTRCATKKSNPQATTFLNGQPADLLQLIEL
jgi:hypothetical protein